MKKFLLILMFFVSLNLFAEKYQVTPYVQEGISLITTAQDLTGSWVDLGSPIDVRRATKLTLFFDIDINNSQNFRFRLLKQITKTGSEFQDIISTTESSAIKFEPLYYEMNVDADTKFVESFNVDSVSYVQVQVMEGVVGATAGQVDASSFSLMFK